MKTSISENTDQTQHANMNAADDWSEECLEYLFDNKIWLPGLVRLELLIVQSFNTILARTTVFYLDTTLAACH